MQYLLSQTLASIKFDSELRTIINRGDIEEILQKIHNIFNEQLDRHQELYWKKEYTTLKIQLEFQIQENLGLRHDLSEVIEDSQKQQEEMQMQLRQIEELQNALCEIEDKLNQMSQDVKVQRSAFEFEQSELMQLVKQKEEVLQNCEQIIQDLQLSMEKLQKEQKNDNSQLKKQCRSEQDLVSKLRQQLQEQKKEIENLAVDKQSIENKGKSMKQRGDTQQKQIKGLEIKLIEANEEIDRLKKKQQQEITQQNQQLTNYEQQNKKLKKKYNVYLQEISKKLKNTMRTIFNNMKLELDALKLYVTKELQQHQLKDVIFQQINGFNENKEQYHSDKMENFRSQIQENFKINIDKQLNLEQDKYQIKQSEYEQKIIENNQQIDQLLEMNRELEDDIQKYTSQNIQLSDLNDSFQREIQQLQEQLIILEQKNQKYQNTIEQQQYQIQDLSEQMHQLLDELKFKQKVNIQDKQMQKQYDDLVQSNQALRKKQQILQEQLHAKEIKLQQIQLSSKTSHPNLNTIEDVEERHYQRMQYIKKY